MNRPYLVASLGNVLLADDAIGALVLSRLEAEWSFPPEVELLDLGTPGLNLMPYLAGREGLVLIDALGSSEAPGSVRVLDREAILRNPPPPRVSPHDLGLKESLALLELSEGEPRPTFLVGVAVRSVEQGGPMTPAVEAAAPDAAREVLDLLQTWGLEPRRTKAAMLNPPWWRRRDGAGRNRPDREWISDRHSSVTHSGI